jgi:hypothetical protein
VLVDGFFCEETNHDHPGVYSLYEAYFFTKHERTSKPYLPAKCLMCNKAFVTYQKKKKEIDPENDYWVKGEGGGVYACPGCFEPGADRSKPTCNRCFCAPCWPRVTGPAKVAAV